MVHTVKEKGLRFVLQCSPTAKEEVGRQRFPHPLRDWLHSYAKVAQRKGVTSVSPLATKVVITYDMDGQPRKMPHAC